MRSWATTPPPTSGAGSISWPTTVRAEQQTAPERLFVRVVDRGREAVVLSNPEGWDPEQLETATLRLIDGTLVQVGKSTEAREDLLARFRAVLGIVTLSIVAIALTGGFLVTRSAVVPIRQLTNAGTPHHPHRPHRPACAASDGGRAVPEVTMRSTS